MLREIEELLEKTVAQRISRPLLFPVKNESRGNCDNYQTLCCFEMAVQKYKNMLMHSSFKFHSRYTGRYTIILFTGVLFKYSTTH